MPPPPHILSPDLVQRLENEYGILHLIYHRNHNQHHVTTWWKDLDILHRQVRKILRKVYEFEETKKHLLRQRLHQEALAIARFMIKKRVFKSCYYSFNGIIALGQFISLGLTLVACVSAISAVIMGMEGLAEKLESATGNVTLEKATPAFSGTIDDDLGEEIMVEQPPVPEKDKAVSKTESPVPKRKLDDIDSIFQEKPRRKEKKTKEKKKKKSRNAIDDIFG